jgi:DNA-3-methyladenine glycosylase I
LSWSTILNKREGYRQAYEGFDPAVVAAFDGARREFLRTNPAIVRNRLKIEASVDNAKAFLLVQGAHGSFDRYLWDFVDGRPIQNSWPSLSEVPSSTPLAAAISKDLKKRGFRFVGPTIVYAFMQAVGMVNDHIITCFRHPEVANLGG